MRKETPLFYFLRLFLTLATLGVMALLYWSTLLIEDRERDIQADITVLRAQVEDLQDTLSKQPRTTADFSTSAFPLAAEETKSTYPNLLVEDPYYTTTLPKQLGLSFKPWGTLHSSNVMRPDNLHPFSNLAEVGNWNDMCTSAIAKSKFGFFENYSPDMALRVEKRTVSGTEIPEFWIFLRKNAFWVPLNPDQFPQNFKLAPHFLKKHPVTAEDYKFYFDVITNAYNQTPNAAPLRSLYGDLESVRVVDDTTFVVRWKTQEVEEEGKKVTKVKYLAQSLTMALRPLAGFLYKYFSDGTKIVEEDQDPDTYKTSSVWAQNFAKHWAKNIIPSCGPWVFKGMSDSQIAFGRNRDYFAPLDILVEESETQFRDTSDAVWQDFKAAKIDTYGLQPDKALEFEQFLKGESYAKQVAAGKGIKRLDFLSRSYSFIGWNEAKPLFKSKNVRKALTMAIDRQRIIRDYLHGMGEEITGTFYKYSPSYDSSIVPLPYDVRGARALLEQEGWYDSDGDGIIDKEIDGKRISFRFRLDYYVKNIITKSIVEFIATSFKEIGILVEPNGIDVADLSTTFDDKNFEALVMGWSLGSPPENPSQLWSSTGAKEKGSSNAIGFSNSEIDTLIKALDFEYDIEKRNALYHRFDQILYDEQPYTFLYSPKSSLLYREYVQNLFIPAERQDLVPGANITSPQMGAVWLKKL